MSRPTLYLGFALLSCGLLCGCNADRDTDQISTESPTTRNSTAENADSTALPTDTTTAGMPK